MLQKNTKVNVVDNSGARKVRIIGIYNKTHEYFKNINAILLCTIRKKRYKIKKTVEKGDIYKIIIIRTKKGLKRYDGSYIRFGTNSAVLLKNDKRLKVIGTRIFGMVTNELRVKEFPSRRKLISLSSRVG